MQIHNAVITGSFSYNGADLSNVTSSNQSSASLSTRVTQIEQVYATTGSNSFRATQSITGSLTVTGQITAQTLNVQQVTSSIVYSSGSNVFGCDLNSRQTFTGSVNITGSLIFNGSTACFANDVYVNGDLRMSGTDSFIWTPANCSNGFTGFYDGYNGQVSLVVCNSNGHLVLQPTKCNVGVGVSNPGQKLEVAGVVHSFDRTNGTVDGAFYASKCGGATSVIIRSCGNTYFNGGNVGIGTDTPITKLQICTTSTAENVVSITNGTQNLQLGVNTTDGGSYVFEKVCGLRLGTADTERMRITSTGIACFACQVCAPTFSAVGVSRFFNAIDTSTTGYRYMEVANCGAAMYYGVERSTAAGLIYNSDPYSTVWTTTNATNLNFGTNLYKRLTIDCTGIAIFTCQVCTPTGVKFGSGASTLNYYETGTWTPDVIRSTSNPTVSYSSREGTYTRVGNTVNLWFDVTMASISGGSGTYLIAGLPFTVSNSQAGYSRVVWRDFSAAIPDANTVVSGFVQKGDTYIYPQNDFTGVCFQTKGATNLQAGRFTGFVSYQA